MASARGSMSSPTRSAVLHVPGFFANTVSAAREFGIEHDVLDADAEVDAHGVLRRPEHLHLADAGAPTLIRQDEKSPALYVLMPMRV